MIRSLKNYWGWLFLGLGILALFLIFRLTNLTIMPIFADEAIYIRWSQVMKSESTLRFLPLSDGKQPLFMWLLMPFFSFISDPLIAGRSLSVISGFGTLVGVILLSYYLFRSLKISFLSGFLYSVVPFAVFFDRMALVDSLLSAFGVWFMLGLVLLTRNPRLDLAMITGILLGGALITKSPALFFVFLLPSTLILLKFSKSKNTIKEVLKLVSLWMVVCFFGFAIYNLLRLGPNFHLLGMRNKDYIFSLSEVLNHPLNPLIPHIGQVWEWFMSLISWPIVALFIFGLIFGLIKWFKQTSLLFLWFAVPLLIQMMIAKVFTARYIYFCLPYFLIICSLGLFYLLTKIKAKLIPNVLINFISLLILFFFAFRNDWLLITNPNQAYLPRGERSGYLEEWPSGYGIVEVRDYLKKLPRDKQIIVGTEGYFGTLPDGLLIYFDKDPTITIIGVGLGLSKIPEELVDSASKGNPTYLVVNQSRMGAQNDPGLELIMKISKAAGQKFQDNLLFYKVK